MSKDVEGCFQNTVSELKPISHLHGMTYYDDILCAPKVMTETPEHRVQAGLPSGFRI